MLQSDDFHHLQRERRNLVQSETIHSQSVFLECRSTLCITSAGFDPFVQRSGREGTRKFCGGQNSIQKQDKIVMDAMQLGIIFATVRSYDWLREGLEQKPAPKGQTGKENDACCKQR